MDDTDTGTLHPSKESDSGADIGTNIPTVQVEAAILKLQDLAYQTMKLNGFLNEEHINEFHSIAESTTNLAEERHALETEYEIETICASKKRHAMQVLPGRYNKEMEDAVLAARLSNESEMMSLQKRLKLAREETEKYDEAYERLTKENILLQPECNRIRKEHDQIIAQLNHRMSSKANKQITLNESRDALRDIKQQISDLGVGHKNLAEDMKKERQEAAATKSQLLTEIASVETAITSQKEQNAEEKRISDDLLNEIMDLNAKLDEERKTLRHLESSHARLEMESLQLSHKIEREKLSNQEIARKKKELEERLAKDKQEYADKISEVTKKMAVVQSQVDEAEQVGKRTADDKDTVYVKNEEAKQNKRNSISKAKEAHNSTEKLKLKTAALMEKTGDLVRSNQEFGDKITLLKENHKATLDIYNSQIDEYKQTLSKEKQERVKVQGLQEESEKVLENYRAEELRYMNLMSKNMENAKQQHQKYAEKSLLLSRDADKRRRRAQTLEVRIEVAQSSYESMISSIKMEIERLKTSIELFESENSRKKKYLEAKSPVVKGFYVELEEKSKEYAALKEEVITIRNKEKRCRELISRTKLQMEKLLKPNQTLKSGTKDIRVKGLEQLNAQAEQRKVFEAELYHTTMKLEQLTKANDRFKQASDQLKMEIEVLKKDMTAHVSYQRQMLKQLEDLEKQFSAYWKICVDMEQESATQDKVMLNGICNVQVEAKERAAKLNAIVSQMKDQLDWLTNFVENVASRRPKDTRQKQRASMPSPKPPTSKRPSSSTKKISRGEARNKASVGNVHRSSFRHLSGASTSLEVPNVLAMSQQENETNMSRLHLSTTRLKVGEVA